MNRVRAGWCCVANPFNPRRVAQVSLDPSDVEAVVFWTRNPRPLMRHLAELDERGLRSYFLFTITGYDHRIDERAPATGPAIAAFRELANIVGADRVVWRYDPIVWTNETGCEYHVRRFGEIGALLSGCTRRVVVSIVDEYRHTAVRMDRLATQGLKLLPASLEDPQFTEMIRSIVGIAAARGFEIRSCAERLDLEPLGIPAGACIDPELVERAIGRPPSSTRKDKSQRKHCRCIESKDIGAYDTCSYGCAYCYATRSETKLEANRQTHDPVSCVLVGTHEGCPGRDA